MVPPSKREVVASLYGVWRLAHFDPRGHAFFDTSSGGVRRSFFAAVLVAPLYLLMLTLLPPENAGGDPARYGLVEGIAYCITWTAYPVMVEELSRRFGVRSRFESYLTAYNWSMVLQYVAFVPLSIFVGLGLVSADLGELCWLVAFALMSAYLWFVARSGLGVTPMTAAGLVIVDVLISVLIDAVATSLS